MTAKEVTDSHLWLQLFPGYNDEDTTIFQEFISRDARAEPGFVVDFLGCRMRASSLWKEAKTLDGALLGPPVPGDFHAEAVEWIGLLKAVRSAAGQYVAMELGAGFGPWSVAGGVAARYTPAKTIAAANSRKRGAWISSLSGTWSCVSRAGTSFISMCKEMK